MYSTRCQSCRQLINIKTEDIRPIVEEAEAKKESVYVMHCTKCRKAVKIPIKELKRKLPAPIVDETPSSTPDETA